MRPADVGLALAGLLGLLAGIGLAALGLAWWRTRRAAAPEPEPAGELAATLAALQQRLEQLQARLQALDREHAGEQARLQLQVETLTATGAAMTQEAQTLRTALTTSHAVRGHWGEAVLENLLLRCGLNQNVDFSLQAELGAERRLRPDAVIHLPSGRQLAIDAKASLTAFLDGREAPDEATRRACDARFARTLRERARELAGKEYSRYLENSLPCVVLFVPSEAAFRAALDADAELFAYGQELQPVVLLASPSTLFPLLSVIAQGWRQQHAAQDVHALLGALEEFGNRLQTFLGHVQKIGKGLDDAGRAFNAAVASYRSRLAPSAAHLRDLGAAWSEPELKPVEQRPLPGDESGSALEAAADRRTDRAGAAGA